MVKPAMRRRQHLSDVGAGIPMGGHDDPSHPGATGDERDADVTWRQPARQRASRRSHTTNPQRNKALSRRIETNVRRLRPRSRLLRILFNGVLPYNQESMTQQYCTPNAQRVPRRSWRDERGQFMVMMGLTLTMLIGITALSI